MKPDSDVVVRTFREGDREAVIAVWRGSGGTRPWNDPDKDIDRKVDADPEGFLVAESGGNVVGAVMVGYEGHRGWIQYLGVAPESQGSGVGRALMAAAIEILRGRGCPKVNLQVRRGNDRAMGFYRNLGFTEDGVVSMGLRLIDDESPRDEPKL